MKKNPVEMSAYINGALAARLPKTQEECCVIAARTALYCGTAPVTDAEFIDAAYGMAQGLFGPAFKAASEDQRWAWIDMCELALIEAAAERQA